MTWSVSIDQDINDIETDVLILIYFVSEDFVAK